MDAITLQNRCIAFLADELTHEQFIALYKKEGCSKRQALEMLAKGCHLVDQAIEAAHKKVLEKRK